MLEALEAAAPARALKASFYVYPLVNAAHVAAVGAVLTSIMVMHARAAGLFSRLDRNGIEHHFRRVAVAAFAVAMLTGLVMFSVNAKEYAVNPAFRVKLLLLILAGMNLAAYVRLPRWKPAGAAASAVLWLSVLVAGRFIGYL